MFFIFWYLQFIVVQSPVNIWPVAVHNQKLATHEGIENFLCIEGTTKPVIVEEYFYSLTRYF